MILHNQIFRWKYSLSDNQEGLCLMLLGMTESSQLEARVPKSTGQSTESESVMILSFGQHVAGNSLYLTESMNSEGEKIQVPLAKKAVSVFADN